MEINCEKGEQVILTDNCDQSFIGIVKSVNQELGRIVLSDVVQLPEHKIITGYRNFDRNEILELKKYEADTVTDDKGKEVHEVIESGKLKTQLVESEIKEIKKLQSKFCYITDFGVNFVSAVAALRTFKKVGFYGMNTTKGRCGRASVIAFSTPSIIFVFDLQTLGDDVFHRGLKEILESSGIIKVVYDCRLLSDCLKHKHLVNLEGVRDVEAEDIMVVYQERRMIRKHSRSLEYLLEVYLGVRMDALEDSAELWSERPLAPHLLDALLRSVSFLIPLQEAIERKYLQRLIDASNMYKSYVRSLDFFQFLHHEPNKTLKKEINKLNTPQTQARADYGKKKLHD